MRDEFTPDRVLLNGKIICVDTGNSIVEAVAIKDGRILATGTTNEINSLSSNSTDVIDLKGKVALPGIIDSHTHPVLQASHLISIECRDPAVKSLEDIRIKIKRKAAEINPGHWIRAVNFNDSKLKERRHITRWELDEVSPDNPVYILSDTGHECIVNSQALNLAGITRETPDPAGGEIQRREDGEPTGLLYEMAVNMITDIMPAHTVEELKPGYKDALDQLSRWGITSTHDAFAYELGFRTFQQLVREGVRQVRMSFMMGLFIEPDQTEFHLIDELCQLGIESGFGDDWCKIIALKLLVDGSGVGGTAAVYKPQYRGPKGLGLMATDQKILEEMTIKAHQAGIRCAFHCVGDKGIDIALDCVEKAQRLKPVPDMRHRLEHITCCGPKQLERIKSLGTIPSSSIGAVYQLGDQLAENFGPERAHWIYPHKSLLDRGIITGGNSDFPVVASNPFEQMYAAVTRKTVTGQIVGPEEAIDILDAIRVYTWNGAYLSKDEDKLGSIEPGKLADIIVIDRDITALPPEVLLETSILTTIVNGEIVYQA